MKLTIYLLKEGRGAEDEFIRADRATASLNVEVRGIPQGKVFVQGSHPAPPKWVTFFQGATDLSHLSLWNSSAGAAWVLNVGGRFFALTFGQGRHLLSDDVCEERFGLKVTLNSIDETKLRTVDLKVFESVARHVRDQASADVGTSAFGLDVERDLLNAVTGTPTEPSYGTKMTGRDALCVNIRLTIEDVPRLLLMFLVRHSETTYRDRFPWVDYISEVGDKTLRRKLDDELVSRLAARSLDRLWLAVPEIVDDAGTEGFHYGGRGTTECAPDVRLLDFLGTLDTGTLPTLDLLRSRHVCRISSEDQAVRDRWPVYKCLYGEVEYAGDVFVLNGGIWYRVARPFVEQVKHYFESFVSKAALPLPVYDHESEGDYNKAVSLAAPETWVCLDGENISYGGGHSKIEFCDLYSTARTLLFVKRYGQSSALSHLFSQGAVSADLLLTDPEFRANVQSILPATHQFTDPAATISPADYHLVFVVISVSKHPLALPFFSLVNLRQVHKRLVGFGFQVSIQKVENLRPTKPAKAKGSKKKTAGVDAP